MVEAFESETTGKAVISHGHTYFGHPLGAAAALAYIAETQRANVVEIAAARGTQMFKGAKTLMQKQTLVGDVWGGRGLMTAIEVASNRKAKKPECGAVMDTIFKTAYEAGVMLRISGPKIILSPPLVLTEADARAILNAIDAGLTATT